ncbi:MAG: hypothetical protein Q9204_001821 [Flavoplaca sp. TL-2023a]
MEMSPMTRQAKRTGGASDWKAEVEKEAAARRRELARQAARPSLLDAEARQATEQTRHTGRLASPSDQDLLDNQLLSSVPPPTSTQLKEGNKGHAKSPAKDEGSTSQVIRQPPPHAKHAPRISETQAQRAEDSAEGEGKKSVVSRDQTPPVTAAQASHKKESGQRTESGSEFARIYQPTSRSESVRNRRPEHPKQHAESSVGAASALQSGPRAGLPREKRSSSYLEPRAESSAEAVPVRKLDDRVLPEGPKNGNSEDKNEGTLACLVDDHAFTSGGAAPSASAVVHDPPGSVVHPSWTEIKDFGAQLWQQHRTFGTYLPSPREGGRLLQSVLQWALIILSFVVVGTIVLGLCLLGWTLFWAFILSIPDRLAWRVCQIAYISPACSSLCGSSWLSLSTFSTCLHYSSRQKQLGIDWAAPQHFEVDNIPVLFTKHEGRCEKFLHQIARTSRGLAISDEDKTRMLELYQEVCTSFGEISTDLPDHYEHVSMFQDVLSRGVESAQKKIQHIQELEQNKSSSDVVLAEQRAVHGELLGTLSVWRERLEFLQTPGALLTQKVRTGRGKLSALREVVDAAITRTERAKRAEKKKWGILRRALRVAGVLRVEPEELYDYNESLATMYAFRKELSVSDELFELTAENVTTLDKDLRKMAKSRFSADIEFKAGPDGLLDLISYVNQVGSNAQGIGKTVEVARVVKKGAVVKNDQSG